MAISIDANIYMIKDRFDISPQRLSQYANKSIDEIMEAEAAQGNKKAANFDREILNDPNRLIEMFRLSDPNNKLAILQSLNSKDLMGFLSLLEKDDLILGLKFFSQDKLLKMLSELPKPELIKIVLEMFSMQDLMKLLPDEQMDKNLSGQGLDKGLVLRHLKTLSPEALKTVLEKITGKTFEISDPEALAKQIGELSPQQFTEALLKLPPDKKRELTAKMVRENPEILQRFDIDAYVNLLAQKDKPDITKAMGVLEDHQLLKMLQELPQDLLAIVATQIDPAQFADKLIRDYQSVLEDLFVT